ncbi:MAG: hypothetical protein KJZ54_02020 [Phycisphaerales bacterium]|nr:hypothetical protein [Phycisphaerales bacterium]
MKAEQANRLVEEELKRLEQSLQQGKTDQLMALLAAAGRFHRYSFSNIMLIATQCPHATQVAGFHTWKKLGRWVKKGEKGIAIVAPIVMRNDRATDEEPEKVVRFRVVHVFDLSQTDGEPLPEIAHTTGDPGHFTERLKVYVSQLGIALEYSDDLGPALGRSSNGKITLVNGLPPAQEFHVLAHELAHEMLHHSGNRPATKVAVETEAEAVSFVVCQAVGLDAAEASRDYIQLYEGDAELLSACLDRIRTTASTIIAAVLHQPAAAGDGELAPTAPPVAA